MPEENENENGPVRFTPTASAIRWTGDTLPIHKFLEEHFGDASLQVVEGRLYILGGEIPFIMNEGWWLVVYLGAPSQMSPERFARMDCIPVRLILPT